MAQFTRGDISLRLASMEDAEFLLSCRNDPTTRQSSKAPDVIPSQLHSSWLTEVISNSSRQLYVAEENKIPFGSVRADFSEGKWELSWTVANEFRGQGLAKAMVALLADNLEGEISAQIKTDNTPSIRVAEYANMSLDSETNEMLYFLRKNKS